MALLYYISYFAVVAAFAFVTLSLASGLLYVSELIEEHSRLAKVIGQRSIYAIIALHVVLYFTDNLPLIHTSFSILCHLVYLQNFSETWPLIDLTSIPFVASCILVVSDHFIWFYYFARLTNEARRLRTYKGAIPYALGFTEVAAFFGLCVWLAPLFLFLSLSANDNALPTATLDPPPESPLGFANPQSSGARVSLIRSAFNLLSFDKVPRFRQPSRRGTGEGLLAPSTPNVPSRPVSPLLHMPLSPRPSYSGPPPRSPNFRGQELEVPNEQALSTNSNVKLRVPPSRRATEMPTRRVGSDSSTGVGLGLRRTSSYVMVDDQ